jgi:hypothetical protein
MLPDWTILLIALRENIFNKCIFFQEFTLRTNKQEIISMCNIYMYVNKRFWQFHLGNTCTAGVKWQLLISF